MPKGIVMGSTIPGGAVIEMRRVMGYTMGLEVAWRY